MVQKALAAIFLPLVLGVNFSLTDIYFILIIFYAYQIFHLLKKLANTPNIYFSEYKLEVLSMVMYD
jgi:hypothetical protein